MVLVGSAKKSAVVSIGHPSFLKHFLDLKMWRLITKGKEPKFVCFFFQNFTKGKATYPAIECNRDAYVALVLWAHKKE